MKYLVFSLLALAACAGTGILLARAIGRKRGLRRGPRALLALGLTLALLLGVGLGYMGRYSRAEASAAAYLNSAGPVAVERIPEGWRFDGPGEGTAVIFYPGARVEAAAYARSSATAPMSCRPFTPGSRASAWTCGWTPRRSSPPCSSPSGSWGTGAACS